MKLPLFRSAMIMALVLAGCAVTPPAQPPSHEAPPAEPPSAQQYNLLAGTTVEVGFDAVSASSASPRYPVDNLLDDNPFTAWGPAADPTPTLFFTLDQDVLLSAFAIKLSLGTESSPTNERVAIAVDVRQDGGAWTTIATGLTPDETVLDTLDLPETMADEVRLRFSALSGDINELLVCQAGFFALVSKPKPTPTPSMTPTPTPTPTPTATPTPFCDVYQTFTQGGWGSNPAGNNPGAFLAAHFATTFPAGLEVGFGNTITLTSAGAVQAFLPQGGTPGVLTMDLVNPTDTPAGVFAGQVTALELNVTFSAAGLLPGDSEGAPLGCLVLATTPFAGLTVNELLALAETVLGGDTSALPAGTTVSQLSDAVAFVNEAFVSDPTIDPDDFECGTCD